MELNWANTFVNFLVTSLFSLQVTNIDNQPVDLSTYKGKVLLFVTTSRFCNMAQMKMEEYNELYAKYHNEGLEILAFPALDFHSEDADVEGIKEFFRTHNARYPVFSPVHINGDKACDLFNFLKKHSNKFDGTEIMRSEKIDGNSEKVTRLRPAEFAYSSFLVDQEGRVVGYYGPFDKKLEGDIQKALNRELKGSSP